VCTTDPCWCVGTIYDPRELPGVSIVGLVIGRDITLNRQHYRNIQFSDGPNYV
jgi:hypothetical protein